MTGHIRRRGERSWELKFDVGTDSATGRRKTRYVSFKGTKREAQEKLVELLAAKQKGQGVDPSRVTVAEFLERWQRDWASLNLAPKTYERHSDQIRLHVVPHIGSIPIQKLRPINLVSLYSSLLRKAGLAPATVSRLHRVLHSAFGHAVEWSIVPMNIAANVSPPKVEADEIRILSAARVKAVIAATQGKWIYPIVMLALATGMRRGELLGLQWGDVDLDSGRLQVERSLEETKKGLRLKPPKTKKGRRQITLPASAVAELRAHWKAQQETRLGLGMGKARADDLIFSAFDGQPRRPSTVTHAWSVLDTGVTFHALRHTHVSMLIAGGLDVLTISRRIGHASASITLDIYGHLFGSKDGDAAKLVDSAIGGGNPVAIPALLQSGKGLSI